MEKSNRNKIIINSAVSIVLLSLAVFYLSRADVITLDALKSIGFLHIFAVFAFFVVGILIWAVCDFLVYRTVTREMPYHKCVMNLVCGNLGSNITPLKSGHFPMMAYYKCNSGIGFSNTITGLVRCQIIYSLTSLTVYAGLTITLAVLKAYILFEEVTVWLWIPALVGVTFHTLICAGILILSFCIPLQNLFLKCWSSILFKFKKTGDKAEYLLQKQEKFRIYREQIKIIFGRFLDYLPACLVYAVYMIFAGSAQYIAYVSVTGKAFTFVGLYTFYTLNIAQTYITNVIPVPGGVGTAEVLFTLVFATVIPDAHLGAVLIAYRVGTYYAVTAIEAIIVPVILFMKRKRKNLPSNNNGEVLENAEDARNV